MSTFDWLLVAHLLGDFVFQPDRLAQAKEKKWRWLLIHTALYTLFQAAALAFLSPDWIVWAVCVAWVLLTHLLLDTRQPVRLYMRLIGVNSDRLWLNIVFDQIFHLLTLVPVAVWVS